MTVKEHYDNHLGGIYSWMCGDFEEKLQVFQQFLSETNMLPVSSKVAIDLGAGHGIQAKSLALSGFDVFAIDFNTQLLHELENNTKNLPVHTIHEDIRLVKKYKKLNPELILCMGDTIAHLDSMSDIELFLKHIFETLNKKGKFILSFRDYGTELTDESRFIPVKSDSNKILMCFLEYFPQSVKVTDILYTRTHENWTQTVSSYNKVRVTKENIHRSLDHAGFKVTYIDTKNRMITVIAEK